MAERRNALKIIGSVGVTCAFPFAADELYAQQEHTHSVDTHTAPLPEPKYFSRDDFAIVAAMAERIIPATSTPGALAAGVPAFIDFVVGRSEEQKRIFAEGLDWMRKKHPGFATWKAAKQTAVLLPICRAVDKGKGKGPEHRFFQAVKALTSDGFWTSRQGMADTLGFRGPAILAEYPECREH